MSQLAVLPGLLLYTDPGTGAMLWQLSAAALIGLAFYFRHYASKIRGLFTARKNKKQ
jgi:hypothetical protein